MFDGFNRDLSTQPRWRITVLTLALVGVVAGADFLTGYELSFSIFYLIPIMLSAWFLGYCASLLVCLLSAGIWLVVDAVSGHVYSHPSIPFWNAGVRTGFFVITASLLVRLRAALKAQALLAERDGLTGLCNSRGFLQKAASLTLLAQRENRPLTLAYIDLDGFKGVNDEYGHGVGDRVLRDVAEALASSVRKSDLVGRLGGDEFAVLLPETDMAGAREMLTALHRRLVETARDNGWSIGFSIGVAVFAVAPSSLEEALGVADDLMYRVKRGGKNDVVFEQQGPRVSGV